MASASKTRQYKAKTPNAGATLAPAFGVNQQGARFRGPFFSSPARTRTSDKAVNSRLLYQLSYRGMRPPWGGTESLKISHDPSIGKSAGSPKARHNSSRAAVIGAVAGINGF